MRYFLGLLTVALVGFGGPLNAQELIAWLETDEEASRESRARRLRHLLEAIQPHEEGMFFQGEELR